MRVGIMQPYFLPYIGYWQLMNAVDKYVIYDDVTFIKGGWINRNRILVNSQPVYFNISLIGASPNTLIQDIEVHFDARMMKRRLKTLEMAYKKAPYYPQVFPMAEEILTYEEKKLVPYLMHSFEVICEYLDIRTEFVVSSAMVKSPGLKGQERVLDICERLGATEYYNAIGGQKLYEFEPFRKRGIELKFLKTEDIRYMQLKHDFVPSLSILDVMMFNSKEEMYQMLQKYSLLGEYDKED